MSKSSQRANRRSIAFLVLFCVGALGLVACQPVGDAWMTGRTSAAANDQIMIVREEPPSFGFQRLDMQSGVYPDLGVFIREQGLPDFLAETTNAERHYLILYYLERREAFACRTRAPRTREVEFAGPYPITPREFEFLSGLKRESTDGRFRQLGD